VSAHTPGPWKCLAADWADADDDAGDVVRYYVRHAPAEITPANGHLISAAPDLLAALKAVEFVTQFNDDDQSWRECPMCRQEDTHNDDCDLRAAIAKAEGR
jgi:hypothetical protein